MKRIGKGADLMGKLTIQHFSDLLTPSQVRSEEANQFLKLLRFSWSFDIDTSLFKGPTHFLRRLVSPLVLLWVL